MSKPQLGEKFDYNFSFTSEEVLQYAKLSGDVNPIHVSTEYAEASEFKCIVHGYFVISIFSKMYGTIVYPDGNILISQWSKHILPIYTGEEYLAVVTIKELLFEKNVYYIQTRYFT